MVRGYSVNSRVSPTQHDFRQQYCPADQAGCGSRDWGRLALWINWFVPMNLPAMNSPAAWASGPAWLAQASWTIHGVRSRSKASTAVLSTQLSVSDRKSVV